MLKQLVNECLITLHIAPEGPVLVKSGVATVSGPDMAFVRTWRRGEPQVYLPGSSLKGVLRSHAERIARTLRMPSACDPFTDCDKARDEAERAQVIACGERFKQRETWRSEHKKDSTEYAEEQRLESERQAVPLAEIGELSRKLSNTELYGQSCPICRLFGSTYYGARLATTDAYAIGPAPRPESRDGVGIDRFTGGASRGAKFDLEVIIGGVFETTLHLRNFELWQLGLVGFLLQDLRDGLIRVGMGKSRGLGKVVGMVQQVRLDYLGRNVPKPANGRLALRGVGSLTERAAAYAMVSPDEMIVDFGGTAEYNGVRATSIFARDSFPWAAVASRWVDYITNYTVPDAMAHTRFVRRR
ncbi:MAG: RAMP superfamily CRISPR-associated protein [Ardenticatenaceae bacterium]|nr:RAMP superfamily CRISPR-associated protein [Ardenticatenaceae bacterium]